MKKNKVCIMPRYNDDDYYEEGKLAVDFDLFSRDICFFADPPESAPPLFVSEVLMRRTYDVAGFGEWVDLVPANDPRLKQSLLDEYLSGKNPSRLYRGAISFNMNFKHWINGEDSLETIQSRLEDQVDAVKLLQKWLAQGQINIYNTCSNPAIIDFFPTSAIFHEVLAHPGISYCIYEDEIITLAQNRPKKEKQ